MTSSVFCGRALLFLRHVGSAEVRRDGSLLLGCDLARDNGSDLIVSFRPDGNDEYWHILRADASETAKRLYNAHSVLAPLNRSTEVGIGLRTYPGLLAEGLLYAFLPTEQSSGLPLHINADFFPEPDRKAVIFAGHQQPTSAHAFYDMGEGRLTVCRPVGERSWAHILNAVFHQLMPEATGGEISKLTLGVRPLMGLPVEDAHRELTDAGVPPLDAGPVTADPDDLVSQELDELGDGDDQADNVESDGSATTGPEFESGAEAPDGCARDSSSEEDQGTQGEEDSRQREEDADPGGRPPKKQERPKRKKRSKHKEQWDRRLLSYVRQQSEKTSEAGESRSSSSEHNLAVEAVARDAVCAYEKARGRIAEQMAQTHPGHDVVSHDPLTGEERLIEVKGVAGEWNQTGVGLSRLQFSNAQKYGDSYWLYVVEFTSDPEHLRIHPIQSPAMQVTSFMFDGNWRDAAADEGADPSLRFIPGVRVRHESMGTGEIRDVIVRGSTKLLTIQFDGRDQVTPNVPLNLSRIHILGEDDDDDNP